VIGELDPPRQRDYQLLMAPEPGITKAATSHEPLTETWFAVAHSGEVGRKPLARRIGEAEIVLFREPTGIVRALEDRCCHRRVPLSLGRLTRDGTLQCAYHGWCYDGSGRCVAIPQLHPEERIPLRFAVEALPAAERQGLVWVWHGDPGRAERAAIPHLPVRGQIVRAGHTYIEHTAESVVDGLLDSPVGQARVVSTPELVGSRHRGPLDITVVNLAWIRSGLVVRLISRSGSTIEVVYSCVPHGSDRALVTWTVAAPRVPWLRTGSYIGAGLVVRRLRVRRRGSACSQYRARVDALRGRQYSSDHSAAADGEVNVTEMLAELTGHKEG